MKDNYLKIFLTGPESTGKTTLAQQLAEHYSCDWVPEYARKYLIEIDRDYVETDLLSIAKGQLASGEEIGKEANELLIFDTHMLVMKVWSNYKYGQCHPWILSQLESEEGLYFLCGTDTNWEYDPLREHPNNRNELYAIYKEELIALKKDFIELDGNEAERLKKAIFVIDQKKSNKTIENA